jgi:hypothetical protein
MTTPNPADDSQKAPLTPVAKCTKIAGEFGPTPKATFLGTKKAPGRLVRTP